MAKHTTCTKVTSLLYPDKVYSTIEEWDADHKEKFEKLNRLSNLDHDIRKTKYIIDNRKEIASDGRSMLHYKDFRSKKDSQRYLQEYWDEQNSGTEDENAVDNGLFEYNIIEK